MDERQYELIFICQPDTPEPEIDKIIATLDYTATEKGAKIEKWTSGAGRGWHIASRSYEKVFYVLMVLKSSHGEVIKELERRLKVFPTR